MGFNPNDVRQALADRITTVLNSADVACAVFPFATTSSSYPQVTILPGDPYVTYTVTFGNVCEVNLNVEVRASATDPESGQRQLGDLLGAFGSNARALSDAIESQVGTELTPTLGGQVLNVTAIDCKADQGVQDGNQYVFGAVISVLVRVDGS